jgi:hypothetical protein
MQKLLIGLAVCLVPWIATGTASAHDKPVKGPHGGQLIHLEDAHYELVANGGTLTVFISDNDSVPRTTLEGATATATVLTDGKTATVVLAPATADTLTGSGNFVAKTGLRVVVSIQEVRRKPAQIRFTPVE